MKSSYFLLATCVCVVLLSEMAIAQGIGRGTANQWLGLLRQDAVQSEIELVEDQQVQIEELQKEMWQEMRDRMSELRGTDLDPADRRAKYAELREQMEERQEEYKERIENVLLPMQVKRLKELQIQSQSRRNGDGAVGVLKNDHMMQELGITDSQREELQKKAEEVRKELEEKIKKLRKEAEKEILSVLSAEQRDKLRGLIGETFEFGNRGARRSGRDMDRARERGERGERGDK